ncbi:hypothetical protein CHS0354_041336 [Potamilus streckersoni]|uniref:Uncharacterized protein n=1 Tax=Potamilus streckersoni TaxID=2493646 RepID=A0AAE0SF09_9BIVA|nr:hypothetical protein CHS0354_041336 [Potamilus streckersoni]
MAASMSQAVRLSCRSLLLIRSRCCPCSCAQHTAVSSAQTTGDVVEKIEIPKRKKRDSLSILKALSSTVGKDDLAPGYMFVDDPYLIPRNPREQKMFALSKSSGREAARYMISKVPDCFEQDTAAPHIPAFMPPKTSYDHTDPTELALIERIQMRHVKNAIEIYQHIKRNGSNLKEETMLRFLELLCVFNGQEPPPVPHPETVFFSSQEAQKKPRFKEGIKDASKTTWDNQLAETLFEELPNKTPEAYTYLIRGMAKYFEADKAFHLYSELKEKKISVGKEVYDTMLRMSGKYSTSSEECFKHIQDLFIDMSAAKVKPDVLTFNAALKSLNKFAGFLSDPKIRGVDYVGRYLAEMKFLGIEPCLATWAHVLFITCFQKNSDGAKLYEIIDHLQGQEMTFQDPDDLTFFSLAIKKVFFACKDLEIAYKIDELVNTGSNKKFLGDQNQINDYYNYFFRVLCMFETVDKIMEYYERLVPHTWLPYRNEFPFLLDTIEVEKAYRHLPRIWSDIMVNGYDYISLFADRVLTMMVSTTHPPELQHRFAMIAKHIMKTRDDLIEQQKKMSVEINAPMMGNIILLFLRDGQFDEAWNHFERYRCQHTKFAGLMLDDVYVEMVDNCIMQQDVRKAFVCVTLMGEMSASNQREMVEKIKKSFNLTDSEREELDLLVSS